MARHEFLKGAAVAAALALGAGAAGAAPYTYVGNWEVYHPDAPVWYLSPPDGPLAYTAQEAAAVLFGGVASDYVISTVGALVDDIDFQGWYDVIGYGGAIFAQDYSNKHLGLYYGPTAGFDLGNIGNAASAWVQDNLSGGGYVNYAFRVAPVPLPAAGFLLLAGLGGLVVLRRRKAA